LRQPLPPLQQLLQESDALRGGHASCPQRRDARRQHALRVEAQVNLPDTVQGSQHQARAGQQYQGQGHLRNHDEARDTQGSQKPGGPGDPHRRQEARQNGCQRRQQKREGQNPVIDGGLP